MQLRARLRAGLVRSTARRYRRILIASLATLGVSATLLGLVAFTQWRRQQALHSDTRATIAQTGQQLLRALASRRGTLTFLRDTLAREPTLSLPHLQAMGESAVKHTRHLVATGFLRDGQPPVWWAVDPQTLSAAETAWLARAILERSRRRGMWRAPSTFTLSTRSQRILLVMSEPLKTAALRRSAVLGVFDVKPLLEDFAATNLSVAMPLQVLDGETLLYRSPVWAFPAEGVRPLIVESPIVMDAARWVIQMQPGKTGVVQTLSWLSVLLVVLSVIAGFGLIIIVWLLAARTWLLQRAVQRRTAALRRAYERMHQMAVTDELTGLHNRRFFLNRWTWEYERAKRYERPLACLMVDVNGFKQVNDRLGHPAGDLVLKQVAQELKTLLRQSDILARFGGDEFIVALPETSVAQAEAVAEKLRQVTISVPEGVVRGVPAVSLSVGLGRVHPHQDEQPQDILDAADQSLYEWKRRVKHEDSRPSRPAPTSSR